MALEDDLKRLFGYEKFRPGQRPLVEALLSGRSALGILPTGGGKSLCYQLPALLRPGLTVVVSPLISLMKDQVDGLRRRGIPGAAEIHSHLPAGEASHRLRDAAAGRLRLLYVSPERLAQPSTLEILRRSGVALFVVDEAHCISHWGHDFRPDYLNLADHARTLGARATLALTATATPRVRDEIVKRLGMQAPCVIVNPFDRPNLFLGARRVTPAEKSADAAALIEPGTSAIVYVGRQADAEAVAKNLTEAGIPAVPYHGGMDRRARAANQDRWIRGSARVVVGTVAFGMGIDKPDVRTVIHLALPSSVEAYYQEIGRAGRDGRPARCWLLHSPGDASLQRWFIERRYPTEAEIRLAHDSLLTGLPLSRRDMPPEKLTVARQWLLERGFLGPGATLPDRLDLSDIRVRREGDLSRLLAMQAWAEARRCRRAILLRYFGEKFPPDLDCRNCDVCNGSARAEHPQARSLGLYTGRRDPDEDAIRAALRSALADLAPKGISRRVLEDILEGTLKRPERAQSRGGSHRGALGGLARARLTHTEEAMVEEGGLDAVPGPRPRLAPSAGPRIVVPPELAIPALLAVRDQPGRLTRTRAARLLGGDVAGAAERLEVLARAGYLSVDGEAKLRLTEKGAEAVRAAELRGAI